MAYKKVNENDPMCSLANDIHTSDEGYRALSVAIVIQAAKDLKHGNEKDRYTALHFFTDKDSPIHNLFPNIDVDALYNCIMYNYDKYKNWKVPAPKKEGER